MYRQILELALARCQSGQAILTLGHCHMTGGDVSKDSVRRMLIGSNGGVRYSGNPLPMSFAEIHY